MTNTRKILYVTGTRADFGLMQATLEEIRKTTGLDLSVLVTGMHLDRAYGHTVDEVRGTGLRIAAEVEIEQGVPSGGLMGRNVGRMVTGITDVLHAERPDIVLLLGDRGEMLAAAIAALHLNTPVAHIHGGERSGTIDEPVRHAISKMSHIHMTATQESAERLVRMGEDAWRVHVVGAPGLDGLEELASLDKDGLFRRHGLDPNRKLALMVYHPVVQEAGKESAGPSLANAIASMLERGYQVLALRPNSDAGSDAILKTLLSAECGPDIHLVTHLKRDEFVSFLRHSDVLTGNSSSGIIEAASFGTPVVNIGSRQYLRERNANVLDTCLENFAATFDQAMAGERFAPVNVYGDGRARERIVSVLTQIDLSTPKLLLKANAY